MLQVLPAAYHLQRRSVSAQEILFQKFCQHSLSGNPGDLRRPHLHRPHAAAVPQVLWFPEYAGKHSSVLALQQGWSSSSVECKSAGAVAAFT